VCWATAAAHPDRVKALVLVDSAGYPRAAKSIPLGFRLAMLPGFNRLMLVTLPRRVVQRSVENVFGDPSKVTPQLVDRYFELTLRAGNRAALPQRLSHAVSASNPKAELSKVRAPTLVLWGGKDLLIPPEQGDAFVRDIAGAKLVRFEALGHVPQEEAPAESLKPVLDFLTALQAENSAVAK
jgi:pimeloyl-ACP methyl ester carboxylesterase